MKCLFCPKIFEKEDEFFHHMDLEHQGISQELLNNATAARETKKQLGEYIGGPGNGVNYECPECFEIFSDIDKLNSHRQEVHKLQLTDEARKKLEGLPSIRNDNPPQCEICDKFYLGLVVCKIDGKTIAACLSCYENHYGTNALRRLTIGTPEDILKMMREPMKLS